MKLVYERESKHEGNDCMIYISMVILQSEESDYFVATKNTFYRGWFGTDSRTESFIFDNYYEAYNYINGMPVNVWGEE